MGQPFIVLGDVTSHGGTVISAAPTTDTHGKGIARIGDMVSCPRCKGIYPIAEGDATMLIDGAPAAYHGCQVACGASLIAGQMLTTTDPSGGAAAAPRQGQVTHGPGFGEIGAGMIAAYEEEPVDECEGRFKGRFRVLNGITGEPVAGQVSRVRSTSGQSLVAGTDAEGCTPWVERGIAEALAFDLADRMQT